MAERSYVDRICIARIDDDSPDLTRVVQSDMRPCVPGVNGFVHAVALLNIRTHVGLAAARVYHVRIARRDGEGANRRDGKRIGDRRPRAPGIDRSSKFRRPRHRSKRYPAGPERR